MVDRDEAITILAKSARLKAADVAFIYKIAREDAAERVMELVAALRRMKGKPTLRDLVKLAQRIKRK